MTPSAEPSPHAAPAPRIAVAPSTPVTPPVSRFEALLLAGVVLVGAVLRVWALDQNGWGADYYSAAVRSMSMNLSNFFFAAFDPAGFVSVDKPPLALWWQVLFVKLLGYQSWALLLPQALLGVAGVLLMHRIVRGFAGPSAGLIAALVYALTPVLVAIHRANNVDAALSFCLLVAAWAMLEAVRTGRRAWLLGAMGAVGLAFNAKMLAAYIVLPALVITHAALAPLPFARRVRELALAVVVLVVTSFAWAIAVEATPAASRPYVGSSASNSVLELMVGHNALGRFVALLKPGAPREAGATAPGRAPATSPGGVAGFDPVARSAFARLFVRAPAGPSRLLEGLLAAQTGWWLPFVLAAWWLWRGDARRHPGAVHRRGLVLWSLWLLTAWIVFSATGGIMHFYYLALLAPAIAALAGVAVPMAWRAYRDPTSGLRGHALPLALLATAAWQIHVHASALGGGAAETQRWLASWPGGLVVTLIVAQVMAATALGVWRGRVLRGHDGAADVALAASAGGVLGALVLPMAWALSVVILPGHGLLPSADLQRLIDADGAPRSGGAGRFGQLLDTSRLVAYLRQQRAGETFLVATSSTHLAAPIIVQWGESVMARGGFHGRDPAVTPEQLAAWVREGRVRFAMLEDLSFITRRLAPAPNSVRVAEWIRAHGRPVPDELWRDPRLPAAAALYDLRSP